MLLTFALLSSHFLVLSLFSVLFLALTSANSLPGRPNLLRPGRPSRSRGCLSVRLGMRLRQHLCSSYHYEGREGRGSAFNFSSSLLLREGCSLMGRWGALKVVSIQPIEATTSTPNRLPYLSSPPSLSPALLLSLSTFSFPDCAARLIC